MSHWRTKRTADWLDLWSVAVVVVAGAFLCWSILPVVVLRVAQILQGFRVVP